ncbi:MAG: hypothetical protein JW395_0221 [Nitrospira sp.]|nr:hypothetical protein [Nitrospira sp.]
MTQSWGAMPEVDRNKSAKPGKPSIAGLHGKATSAACVAIVAVIALQAFVIILKLVQAPPAWAWYADPAYQYLLNGAALVSGDTPYLLYHPGMSLIWLVGLTEFVVHLVSPSAESVLLDSVQQPEHHIAIQQGILGFAYLVGLGFLAWRTLRSFGPLPALVLQLLILWSLTSLSNGILPVMPESLMVISALFSLAALVPAFAHPRTRMGLLSLVGLGVFSAIGVTAKVLFLPMFLLPLFLLRSRQLAIWFVSTLGCAVLLLFPSRSRFPWMVQWFEELLLSGGRGHDGVGSAAAPIHQLVVSLSTFGLSIRWFWGVTAVIVLLTVVALLVGARGPGSSLWLGPVAIISSVLGFMLLGFRSSVEIRDLVLIGLLVPFLAMLATFIVILRIGPGWHRASIVTLTLIATMYLAAHGVVGTMYNWQANLLRAQQFKDRALAVEALAGTGDWATGYDLWSVDTALTWAWPWAPSTEDAVGAVVGEKVYFDRWARTLTIAGSDITCEEAVERVRSSDMGILVTDPAQVQYDDAVPPIQFEGADVVLSSGQAMGELWAFRIVDARCSDSIRDRRAGF